MQGSIQYKTETVTHSLLQLCFVEKRLWNKLPSPSPA